MNARKLLGRPGLKRLILAAITAFLCTLTFIERAEAIPTFARKYATSCITCHTVYPKLNDTGEAFRRNGFQFPSNEDVLVKEEPVKMGTDSYKAMFPNSIWPSTLPSIPPISLFAQEQNIVYLRPKGQEKTVDFVFPSDIEFIGAGAFGQDISGLYNIGFDPDGTVGVGRVFVQFSNVFAWSAEEDEDGTHEGSRWAVLPPHALNLKIGKIDPGVIPHVISEESFPLLQNPAMPSNTFTLGQTGFSLFVEQPGIEINGIIEQYWSYCVGIANGGSAAYLPEDDNTFKDVYFRVARKWYGFPLDGVVGAAEQGAKKGEAATPPVDDSIYNKPGLDFWRAVSFETGFFGWFGKSNVPSTFSPNGGNPFINPVIPNDPSTYMKDYFTRLGVDARVKYFDLDVYGMFFWGHDPFPGFDQTFMAAGPTDHLGFFVQADYMWKPWIMSFLRYEQVKILNPGLQAYGVDANGTVISGGEEARLVPGVIFQVRQNVHVSSEIYIDLDNVPLATGYPEATCQWITTVSFAF